MSSIISSTAAESSLFAALRNAPAPLASVAPSSTERPNAVTPLNAVTPEAAAAGRAGPPASRRVLLGRRGIGSPVPRSSAEIASAIWVDGQRYQWRRPNARRALEITPRASLCSLSRGQPSAQFSAHGDHAQIHRRQRRPAAAAAAAAAATRLAPTRSAAAAEGIANLKAGSDAMKHGRKGKPYATTFTLSSDERTLTWVGKNFLGRNATRELPLGDVLELMIGHESEVFQRSINSSSDRGTQAHLSLSLLLLESEEQGERASLDLSFSDDEQFGLWVAALRTLIAEAALAADDSLRELDRTWSTSAPVVPGRGAAPSAQGAAPGKHAPRPPPGRPKPKPPPPPGPGPPPPPPPPDDAAAAELSGSRKHTPNRRPARRPTAAPRRRPLRRRRRRRPPATRAAPRCRRPSRPTPSAASGKAAAAADAAAAAGAGRR